MSAKAGNEDGGEKGLSKKELNKLKKKAQKAEAGPSAAATAPKHVKVYYCTEAMPELTLTMVGIYGVQAHVATHILRPAAPHQPYLTYDPAAVVGGDTDTPITSLDTLSGDLTMAKFIARAHDKEKGCEYYCRGGSDNMVADSFAQSQVDQWCDFSVSAIATGVESTEPLSVMDAHLATRTFLAGESASLADIACYLSMKKEKWVMDAQAHVGRWYRYMDALLKNFPVANQVMAATLVKVKVPPASATAAADGAVKSSAEAINKSTATGVTADRASEDGGVCPPLEGADEAGAFPICTRFPPEPSGYLHIGHAKAVLLNQYYAQRYKGKLIVRFDDTNPAKEKDEYEQAIIADLKSLGVQPTVVCHTSDSFDIIQKYAYQIIEDGLAYMDDTDQETMQAERMEHKECARRSSSTPAENKEIFTKLLEGDPDFTKFCLRAKIDMTSQNGTMRDPVLFRSNVEIPHHRTGTKYKAYPTYDFACPIVDSIEGVSHALRTTEYHDRDEQYHWIQAALRLRKVHIYSFGKMNFINTVLSKRKLNWFVEQKLVEGWFDPRFPTVQGCVRRGINIEALKSFILSQGASKRAISMEWDKFWAENKRVLEDIAPRYMGITEANIVPFTVTNVEAGEVAVSTNIHPLKAEMGTRLIRRFNVLYVEQEDAATYKQGEEITFLRWGNFIIDSITRNADGKLVTGMTGRFNADAKNFSKTKKTTWLAAVPDVVQCQLVEFDHLISKPRLGDDEDFKDFLNPVTKHVTTAVCDPLLRTIPAGTVIQLERKGFYRVDKAWGEDASAGGAPVLFYIPDGRKEKPLAEKYGLVPAGAVASKK